MKVSTRYHERIHSLFIEGFSIFELAIMYRTKPLQIEHVLETMAVRWEEL